VLSQVDQSRRGIASGAIFAGIGLGIAASGTLIPLLLRQGLAQAWLGLGMLSAALTAVAWSGWPQQPSPLREQPSPHVERHSAWRLRLLYGQYALNAVGLVPHMLYLVDFVARDLRQGLSAGAQYWVLFGLGAVVGPVLSGHLADRIGYGPALRLAFLAQGLGVVLPAVQSGQVTLIISSLVVGAFTPGIVPLVLGRTRELLPHDAEEQKRAWSMATTAFALLQAGGAYGLTFVFAYTGGNDRSLFAIGASAFALAFASDVLAGGRGRAPARPGKVGQEPRE
jgi:predicted MFS family arabinose efflux permease